MSKDMLMLVRKRLGTFGFKTAVEFLNVLPKKSLLNVLIGNIFFATITFIRL